jgi:hypothetical protein
MYAVLGSVFVLLIFVFVALIQISKLRKRFNKTMRNTNGDDLTKIISDFYKDGAKLFERSDGLDERISNLERRIKLCGQKIAAMRYDAFGDNVAKLSFVVAVLDANDDGFIINGVNTRSQTATYLKVVENGKSVIDLSNEEKETLRQAVANYAGL